MSPTKTTSVTNRLRKYSVAAASLTAAAAATSATADADIVFLDLSASPVSSTDSVETFVDILGFTRGASSISISVATSTYSAGNPLAPNSEFMLRGFGPSTSVRGNNGAEFGYYSNGGYLYLENVGAVGNVASAFDGTNNLTMYFDAYGGPFDVDTPGVAHFTFTNTDDGETYNGWLDLVTTGVAGDRTVQLTGITVDTLEAIPEPTGMALLCLGAAGIGTYRRRKS